ncbi:MAG: DNRLRE domain-containing protein [Planctomycetota bacterium]
MLKHPLAVLSIAACVIAAPVSASVITLDPSADAFVRGGSNANNTQNGTAAQNLLVLPGNDLSFARKTYIRFDLTTITGPVADAELTLEFTFANTASGGLPINIYAINDGVAGEDNWSEAGLTWNNAPSNLTTGSTSQVAAGVIAAETTLIDSITPTGPEIAGGATYVIDTAALLSALQADTNDAITFVITGNAGSNSPVRPLIASRENPGGGGASLAVVIPEPASLSLLAAGSLWMATRRRKRSD